MLYIMKQIPISLILKTGVLTCLFFTFSLSVMSKSVSPFEAFHILWQQNVSSSEEFSLITDVSAETLEKIVPQLKKELKVKNDVHFSYPSNVGNILTTLLKERYGSKSNAKNDFLAIQYSTNSVDFDNYLKKYPDSKYKDEALAKAACFKGCEMMIEAKINKTRKSYEAFTAYCAKEPSCNYEGCATICDKINAIANEIVKWYDIIDSSAEKGSLIYRDYESYIQTYGEEGMFANAAIDSLSINKERFDWNNASSENTIKAYENYMNLHHDGLYYWRASFLVDEMKLWEKAETSRKYEDYCAYYSEYTDGIYAEKAIEKIKQFETDAWNVAKRKNTLAAYEAFLKQFPNGYYASEAGNKVTELRIAPYLKEKPTFSDMSYRGDYSKPNYSLICLGNVDRDKNITISLTGPTGFSKTFKPGQYEWVKVKNGTYKVLVQASTIMNWWGTAYFETGVYAQAWYSYMRDIIGHKISENKNMTYVQMFLKVVNDRAKEETDKTQLYLFGGI